MFNKTMNPGVCGRRASRYNYHSHFRLLALAAFAAIGCAPALAESIDRPAYGLIVKLKDSAPALITGQVQRLSATQGAAADDAASRSVRLQGVLRAAAVPPSTQRPVGRSAQLLGFGRVLSAAEAERMADQLRSRPEVEWVVPNQRERRLQVTVPNDPLFGLQWWLQPVSGSNGNVLKDRLRGVPGFQSAWAVNNGAPQAVVAVLDTGITRHPDLDAHVLPGYDFVANPIPANDGDGRDADPSDPGDGVSAADKAAHPTEFANCVVEDSSWHGTEVAALIAGVSDNGLGVAAINWNARVLPVRVAGKCGAEVADILDGMRWAAGLPVAGAPLNPNPARVINISFGSDAACNPAYQAVIDELAITGAGVVVVAAAGNAHAAVDRPANCKGVVAVAGLNRDGFKNTYSNFGPQVVVSTVSGDPGSRGAWGAVLGDDGLLTLGNQGTMTPGTPGYYRVFGTSFAAPVAAGVISLMLSVNPNLTGAQIINGLRASARPHVSAPKMGVCSSQNPGRCSCDTANCGAGILDALQAVRYAGDPAAYVSPAQQPAIIDNADVDKAVSLGPDQPANPPPATGSQGGGGAIDPSWLLGLTAGTLALWACRRRRPRSDWRV